MLLTIAGEGSQFGGLGTFEERPRNLERLFYAAARNVMTGDEQKAHIAVCRINKVRDFTLFTGVSVQKSANIDDWNIYTR